MAEQPLVSVRGEATREVPPELAVFSVTVSARGRDRAATLTRIAERSAAQRVLLDSYSTVIERRETGRVDVFPEIKGNNEKVAAYHGNVTTTVAVTDFSVLGDLLLRLAGQDQTAIAGPWWQLRPGSTAGAEVRREAVADALRRAREYAEAVGARLDSLVEIRDEGTGDGFAPATARTLGFRGGAAAEMKPALEIDPQPQTVHAAVIVRATITQPTELG
jgi:uncharacterized protein YggE